MQRILVDVYADLVRFHGGEYEEEAFLQSFVANRERSQANNEFDYGSSAVVRRCREAVAAWRA